MPEPVLLEAENQPGRECRVYERQACELPTACRPAASFANKESAWGATICDISVGGIRLVLRRRFEPGTGLAIELPGADEPYTVLAKVVHVKATANSCWALGCQFISELSESEVERLLHWVPVEADEATEIDTMPEEAPAPEAIRDLRLRVAVLKGAAIECIVHRFRPAENWPVPTGTVMAVRGGSGAEAWSLDVLVRQCVERDDDWLLDCELANPPSAPELLRALAAISHRAG